MKREINYLDCFVIRNIGLDEDMLTTDFNVVEYYKTLHPNLSFSIQKAVAIKSAGHLGVYLLGRRIL